jgi:hypothetical protein
VASPKAAIVCKFAGLCRRPDNLGFAPKTRRFSFFFSPLATHHFFLRRASVGARSEKDRVTTI